MASTFGSLLVPSSFKGPGTCKEQRRQILGGKGQPKLRASLEAGPPGCGEEGREEDKSKKTLIEEK